MELQDLSKSLENVIIKFVSKDGDECIPMIENLNKVLDVLNQVLICQVLKRMSAEKKFLKTDKKKVKKTVKKFTNGAIDEYFDYIYEQIKEIAEENPDNVLSIV